MIKNPWIKWPLYFAIWSIIGVGYSLHLFLIKHDSNLENPWIVLWWGMPDIYIWAVLALFILPVARKFPLGPQRIAHSLLIHLASSVVFAATHLLISVGIDMLIYANPIVERMIYFFRVQFLENMIYYWVLFLLYNAWSYYHKYQDRKITASQLETQLAHAQVQALRMQLNPHFLFNTLNAISALVEDEPKAARTMLARLSDLLRHTLDSGKRHRQSLKEELEFIKLYLNIELVRFSDRLNVDYKIAPETQDLLIPNLMLQPLVENAIVHGIANRVKEGQIVIQSSIQDHQLLLHVWDNGPELKRKTDIGIGLSNTQQRLQHLYGNAATLELKRENNGTLATLLLPIDTESTILEKDQHEHEHSHRRRRIVGKKTNPFPA